MIPSLGCHKEGEPLPKMVTLPLTNLWPPHKNCSAWFTLPLPRLIQSPSIHLPTCLSVWNCHSLVCLPNWSSGPGLTICLYSFLHTMSLQLSSDAVVQLLGNKEKPRLGLLSCPWRDCLCISTSFCLSGFFETPWNSAVASLTPL